MNKRQYSYMIHNEIKRINRRIDNKILLGYSYDQDARRHKVLLETMRKMNLKNRAQGFFRSLIHI